jgi:uncharacterized protein YjbI with pentapeptide repeats
MDVAVHQRNLRAPVRQALHKSWRTQVELKNSRDQLVVHDSDLAESHISDTKLSKCSFTNVNLQRSSFRDVNLSDASFTDVNLTNVSISDSNVTGMTINGVLVSDLIQAYRQP